jgi:serine/threonine-protein kinase
VPKGLSVVAAISGSGSCVTSGQLVTCTTEPLAPRSTTPISIVVKTSAPGSFTDTATAASSLFSDPNTANNVASADLTVTPVPTASAQCHVVALRGVRLSTAKSVLRALSCAVGKVSKKASKTVPKGDVISTSPRSGSRPAGAKVAVVESSGKPKHKRG